MSLDKFGNNAYNDEDEDDIEPLHSHSYNLDDLENVEGFNSTGKKNKVYGFKLDKNGIYKREEISTNEFPFDKNDVNDALTPLNIVFYRNQWKLIKKKHEFEINIKIRNNTITYHGDSKIIHRIYNSGRIFGNFMPAKKYINSTVLQKYKGNYYIAAKKETETVLEFIPKFSDDVKMLTDPPVGSTFIIAGVLLNNHEERPIVEGLEMKIQNLTQPEEFIIIVTKNKNEFKVKTFSDKINVRVVSDDVNLNKIKIYSDKYIINKLAFTTTKITEAEIYFLIK